jgi:hypothetical protein
MLVVEEKMKDSPRKLTKEEHRDLLSLSLEEYEQKVNFWGAPSNPINRPHTPKKGAVVGKV